VEASSWLETFQAALVNADLPQPPTKKQFKAFRLLVTDLWDLLDQAKWAFSELDARIQLQTKLTADQSACLQALLKGQWPQSAVLEATLRRKLSLRDLFTLRGSLSSWNPSQVDLCCLEEPLPRHPLHL
jgi:hypothetical protein